MSKPFMCGDEVAVYVPEGGCDCNYTLQRVDSDQYAYAYKLLMNGTQVGDLITVPFDKYVNACQLKTVDMAGYPYPDAQIGDAYLDMTFQNYPEHIYVSLASIMGGGYLIVDELPAVGDPRYIYLVDDGQGNYDRYVWDKDAEDWVNIGGTSIDLSNYYTKSEIDNLIGNIMLRFYPVGAIYTSINDTDPGTMFGGTWTRLTDTFLLAAGSSYPADDGTHTTATGGSPYIQDHIHRFVQPTVDGGSGFLISGGQHNHNVGYNTIKRESGSSSFRQILGTSAEYYVATSFDGSHTHTTPNHSHSVHGGAVDYVQGVTAGNAGNMPPYLTVYMWKRIA